MVIGASLIDAVIAQDWVPSRFDADDRIGAAHNLSAEIVLQAAKLITTGKVYSLGVETAEDSPAHGTRTFSIDIIASGVNVPVGTGAVTSNDERVTTRFGIGSQIDGLGHHKCPDCCRWRACRVGDSYHSANRDTRCAAGYGKTNQGAGSGYGVP